VKRSAFVYGTYSFVDKITNGLLIFAMSVFALDNQDVLKAIIILNPTIMAMIATCLSFKLY